jgi:hypothetical protein
MLEEIYMIFFSNEEELKDTRVVFAIKFYFPVFLLIIGQA